MSSEHFLKPELGAGMGPFFQLPFCFDGERGRAVKAIRLMSGSEVLDLFLLMDELTQ